MITKFHINLENGEDFKMLDILKNTHNLIEKNYQNMEHSY